MAEPATGSTAWHVLPVAAPNPEELLQLAWGIAAHLRDPAIDLAAFAAALGARADAAPVRAFVIANTADRAAEELAALRGPTATATAEPGVAMMFPGQGSQRLGMAARLRHQEPVFARTLDSHLSLAKELAPNLELERLLLENAAKDSPDAERLNQTEVTQPAVFLVSIALARLWQSWGVEPAVVMGHSIGEYAAACVAGIMSSEDALRLVIARGRLMQALPSGTMLAVGLPEASLGDILGPDVSLAAVNGPKQCVLAGPSAAITAAQEALRSRGVAATALRTSHAFHSSMMEPMLAPFREVVSKVRLAAPRLPMLSTVTGKPLAAETATSTDYWVNHVRMPVRFLQAAQALVEIPGRHVLEVGPGGALAKLIGGIIPSGSPLRTIASLPLRPDERVPEDAILRRAAGTLYCLGARLRFDVLAGGAAPSTLPSVWPRPATPTTPTAVAKPPKSTQVPSEAISDDAVNRAVRARKARLARGGDGSGNAGARDGAPASTTTPEPAVPSTARRNIERTTPYDAPEGEVERQIAAIWEDILGAAPVGRHDDFAELGGDSLSAHRVMNRIRKLFNLEITTRHFMSTRTVAEMAAVVGRRGA